MFNPRRQLLNRLSHGLAEVIQLLPVHSLVKGFAHINAGQPELDVVGFVVYRVLVT